MQEYQRSGATSTVQDDPAARDLLRRAFEKTYRWPAGFGGFSADLVIEQPDRRVQGRVELRSARDLRVTLDDAELQKWAEGQFAMIAVHRGPRSFEESDGKSALALGPEDHHPLGRLLILGDAMNSCYRIKDDRITQINRTMEQIAFTINVDDSLKTPDGRHLTTRYTVYYFTPKESRLTNVESFNDQPAVVDGIHLPGTRTLSFFDAGRVQVRRTTFLRHALL